MKRTVSTLLFAFCIVAVAAIETEVQEHMQQERVKAAHHAVDTQASGDAGTESASQSIAAMDQP